MTPADNSTNAVLLRLRQNDIYIFFPKLVFIWVFFVSFYFGYFGFACFVNLVSYIILLFLSGQPPERVTSNKSQYAYFDPRSGYLSEPEGGLSRLTGNTWSDAYDSDVTSGPRRRTASVQEDRRMNETITYHMPNNK